MSDQRSKYKHLGSNLYQIEKPLTTSKRLVVSEGGQHQPVENKLGRLLMAAIQEKQAFVRGLQKKFYLEIQQLEKGLGL